jgi:glycosyltransferase involved in cell wall biosynthesis
MSQTLNFFGTAGQGQGYSGSNEQLTIALDRLPDIDVISVPFTKTPQANISPAMQTIRNKPFKLGDVGIVYGFPSAFTSNVINKFRVGMTMFETDRLPTGKEWAGTDYNAPKLINDSCDLLIVTCEHNKALFSSSGVTIPIEVVPLGINPDLFPYYERPTRKTFTFFMWGTLTLRKNPGMVISAFANLFKDNPDVKLVLKTQSGTLGHVEYVDMGDITVIDELWTVEKLYEALKLADCMVFPSRGEGFGIPPLEAMATGLPTIISDNTGMADYTDARYNFTIPTEKITPAQRYPIKWGNVGNWYEPNYDELKDTMDWIYKNRDQAKLIGKQASTWVHDYWTYDNSAEKLVQAIKKHYPAWK